MGHCEEKVSSEEVEHEHAIREGTVVTIAGVGDVL